MMTPSATVPGVPDREFICLSVIAPSISLGLRLESETVKSELVSLLAALVQRYPQNFGGSLVLQIETTSSDR